MPTRYDLTKPDIARLVEGPSYRVEQIWHGLYRDIVAPSELTTLGKDLRQQVARQPEFASALDLVVEKTTDDGNTIKWLFALPDGRQVETVLMHYDDRSTVCVSSQAGCAMNCSFCATGQAGFDRHLTTGEIVEQVAVAAARARGDNRRLSNIVFMGMGEPMANFDAVWQASERAHFDLGLSARHITISTVGVVPGILKLASKDLPVSLAVSLHAANDELRTSMVPLNKRYPIADLMDACETYIAAHNRRLSFEWALISDTNDSDKDAAELAALALRLNAHVNVIPLNPTPGYLVRGTSRNVVHRFVSALRDRGVNATIRDTRGSDIDAACGQLAADNKAPVKLRRRQNNSA